jgi:hypothetical protein
MADEPFPERHLHFVDEDAGKSAVPELDVLARVGLAAAA